MLELLDTGRLAYRFGKWRGLVYMGYGLATGLLVWLIPGLFAFLPSSAALPKEIQWLMYGLFGLAVFLWVYGLYRLYRDHNHRDDYFDADRYKRDGW